MHILLLSMNVSSRRAEKRVIEFYFILYSCIIFVILIKKKKLGERGFMKGSRRRRQSERGNYDGRNRKPISLRPCP